MPVKIIDTGTLNELDIPENIDGTLHISGRNNKCTIGRDCGMGRIFIKMYGDSTISIGENCRLGGLQIHAKAGCSISIGRGVIFNGMVRLLAHEPGMISIGNECLFAGGVDVMISDMHSIVDVATGLRINPAKDVIIDDHVWIAQRATILKGVRIGTDAVIAAGSVVTKDVLPGCIASGVPAKVTRSGITWTHKLLPM